MKIVAIYLAAGIYQRVVDNNLSLPIGKMSLGSLALETVLNSSLQKVFVVLEAKDDARWISPEQRADGKLEIVQCPTAYEGLSSSLRYGIERAQEEKADAAMFFLADQPFITVLMIEELIACMEKNPACDYVATPRRNTACPTHSFFFLYVSGITYIKRRSEYKRIFTKYSVKFWGTISL